MFLEVQFLKLAKFGLVRGKVFFYHRDNFAIPSFDLNEQSLKRKLKNKNCLKLFKAYNGQKGKKLSFSSILALQKI